MWYFKKTLRGIGLIFLLQVLKKIPENFFPESAAFYDSILSCIQVIILLWLIMALAFRLRAGSIPDNGKKKWMPLLAPILLLSIGEMISAYLLQHPSRIPSFLVPLFRQYYGMTQRNIIQFDTHSSVYNRSLLYTLKPSSRFLFSNYEFSDSFYTNQMGLRDDENSLLKPDIICLGDSYAMGWGVPQHETFSELISHQSGEKVLNAAISSYGTARELINLYRLDTSALQNIIIQYNRNDAWENAEFIQRGYSLKVSPENIYHTAVNTHYWNRLWFPGKHFTSLSKLYARTKLKNLLRKNKKGLIDSSSHHFHQSVADFANILLRSGINFRKTRVYVIDINQADALNDDFVNELKSLLTSPPYNRHFNNNLVPVPVSDILNSGDYYILDDHLRPSGHRKIAERLGAYIYQ